MSSIRPLRDRVVIQREKEEKISSGGIVIPDTANAEKPTKGRVCFVGEGGLTKEGALIPMTLKVGDKVLFGRYSGTEVKIDGTEYVIMKEEDVLAVVED